MNIIESDLYRYFGKTGFTTLLKGLRVPGFRFMYFYRKASAHNKYSVAGLFYRMFYARYFYKYGFQIELYTNIGKGFYIGHFGSVVINHQAIIGDNCNIAHGVTIGKAYRGKLEGCPKIGNRVWIGTGAVIVGNINIGDDVMIAPNAFINFNVPPHSMVMGNPAKIVAKENPAQGYLNNIVS
jgi:serine O-acetyltransferase